MSRIQDLTHDVRAIELRLLEPSDIIFKAGQFVSFEMPKEGQPRPVTRPYSIASPPSQGDRILLILNLVQEGPVRVTSSACGKAREPRSKGRRGHFILRDDGSRDLLFVATGTGIAPFRSMILAQLERGESRSVTLFWGLRSQRDLYLQEELQELARAYPKFSYVTTLSRPEPGWNGAIGRVTTLIDQRVPSVKNLAAYLMRRKRHDQGCHGKAQCQGVVSDLSGKVLRRLAGR